jgi:hypothetical protein
LGSLFIKLVLSLPLLLSRCQVNLLLEFRSKTLSRSKFLVSLLLLPSQNLSLKLLSLSLVPIISGLGFKLSSLLLIDLTQGASPFLDALAALLVSEISLELVCSLHRLPNCLVILSIFMVLPKLFRSLSVLKLLVDCPRALRSRHFNHLDWEGGSDCLSHCLSHNISSKGRSLGRNRLASSPVVFDAGSGCLKCSDCCALCVLERRLILSVRKRVALEGVRVPTRVWL